jgi:hypothetical protein
VIFGTNAVWAQAGGDALRLGAGQPGGAYSDMAEDLADLLDVPLRLVTTEGTLDNLKMLARGDIDVAIVQNDISHYVYRGTNGLTRFSGFKSLLPLFPEYVHIIVRRDANIDILADLRAKKISVGPRESGSYHNAIHILDEIGLSEGVDFNTSYLSQAESLDRLRDGSLDAAFATGQLITLADLSEVEQLIIPTRLIESLSDRLPYYRMKTIDSPHGQNETYLSVTAYLVISDQVSSSQAQALTRSIISRWPELRERWPALQELESVFLVHPVPHHAVVRTELERAGYLDATWPLQLFIGTLVLGWLLILGVCFYAIRNRTTYNRLGATADLSELSIYQRIVNIMAYTAPWILGISAFVTLLIVSFWLVKFSEEIYSQTYNVDNEFVGMDPIDGVIWLFSFVASGFTLQDRFPQSDAGRLIANIMALAGVMGPISLIILVIADIGRKRDRQMRGEMISDHSGHVLICGWNEKAAGIIFSLTSNDVDKKRDVTIVADCEDSSPLEKHKFDPRYVRYCQGNSSSRDCLQRANAALADTAIVLCDHKHRANGNLTGVLTVMNLRALRSDMHICAELAFDKNASHFVACGCNTLISPDKLIARMAVLSTVSPLLVDFIFDILTFNKSDRFIADTVESVESLTGEILAGRPAYEAHQFLIRRGANVIGLVLGGERQRGLFESSFGGATEKNDDLGRNYFLPLTTSEGRATILEKSHVLIFSAHSRNEIRHLQDFRMIDKVKNIRSEDINIRRHKSAGILVFGKEESETICEGLSVLNDESQMYTEPAPTQLMTEEQLGCCLAQEQTYSHVILLVNKAQRNARSGDLDMNEVDATTVLNTRLIRTYFEKRQPGDPVQITVEALTAKNRAMFKTAGADSIICSLTLVERFLTKEVYEKSQILDYVMALLNVTDRVHLYSFEVRESDGICGKPYAAILKSRIEGFRLVGWLPHTQRENLRNQQGDFDFHFRTVISRRIVQTNVQAGDQLVVVVDRRRKDWLKQGDTD